jgi:hypothetical protein
MRPRPKNPVIEFDNQAEPPASVVVTVRRVFGGLVTQCTWYCRGCRAGDDQGQALAWACQAAAGHAASCYAKPFRYREN